MKRTLLFLLLAAILVSCGPRKITEQQHSFKDRQWKQGQPLTYTFNITDTAASYDIATGVKHFESFPFDRVQISFTLEDPSGESRVTQHDLILRNKEGRFLSKKTGDTLKMEFAIRNRYKFKATGQAKVTLINQLPYLVTDGLGGISIVVKKR